MDKSITGILTGVSGERFELSDDANRRHVFMLAMDASLEAGELPALQRDGTRVTVDYDDDTPDAHIAHRIFATPQARPAP
ncbi:MAG TPA: hypothetical protein VFP44_24770 [Usitatibacter sp.]|nr:hypothetical protein [Usitatibacter sp.]